MNVKRMCLFLAFVIAVTGLAFAQNLIISEGEAYCWGLYTGYINGSLTSPFTDSNLTAAWRTGYRDGIAAATQNPSFYSYKLSPSEYLHEFSNMGRLTSDFSEKRLGISWSPIFKYKSKEYVLGPNGVYEYEETAFGLELKLIRK
jgi:hypothetical protein